MEFAPYNYLYSQGYQLAYTGSSNGHLMSTSIFGNHPDAIWFKPEKIQSGKQGMIDFLTPNLSDHQGLSWTLSSGSLNKKTPDSSQTKTESNIIFCFDYFFFSGARYRSNFESLRETHFRDYF